MQIIVNVAERKEALMAVNPNTAAKLYHLEGLTSYLEAMADPLQKIKLDAFSSWDPGTSHLESTSSTTSLTAHTVHPGPHLPTRSHR